MDRADVVRELASMTGAAVRFRVIPSPGGFTAYGKFGGTTTTVPLLTEDDRFDSWAQRSVKVVKRWGEYLDSLVEAE